MYLVLAMRPGSEREVKAFYEKHERKKILGDLDHITKKFNNFPKIKISATVYEYL